MSETLFKNSQFAVSALMDGIDRGDIGLPDIQRPFVWKTSQVRDLFDSMYKGFPVGYLLFWANDGIENSKVIGVDHKQVKEPKLLILDGQQRLTSLYAVLKEKPILTKEFKNVYLRIAFRPLDGTFTVADAATDRDPEYIPNISSLWADDTDIFEFTDNYIEKLRSSRDISDTELKAIRKAMQKLFNIQKYIFVALEIASDVDEEKAADIFVRINSKQVSLNQADFIITLMSVFWDEGRKKIEDFCQDARQPTAIGGKPSSFNHFIEPDPAQILRVCIGLGFKRAQLRHVYSLLRGKDLETGDFSAERRESQFAVLKRAQEKTLDLTNWTDFQKVLIRAGFRSRNMISSELALLYAYTVFLIGKYDYGIDHYTLRNVIARWFFMIAVTHRYTGSPESRMESDLGRIYAAKDGNEFISILDKIIRDTLTDDYWNITLVNELETSSARAPGLFAYYAALNLLDANVLFSKMKVSELLDPSLQSKKKAIERHHLFPKNFLKSLGIIEAKDINQAANFALVEWGDNIDILDNAPFEYVPNYVQRFSSDKINQMNEWHALPDGWTQMDYKVFLAERRKRMAKVVRLGFESLMQH